VQTLRIDVDIHIDRPVESVFGAWTTAAALAEWFAPMAIEKPGVELDFREGGRYAIRMPLPDGAVFTTTGEFREIVANEKIVMTWHCDAFPDPPTVVTVTFVAEAGGTTVRVVHERFESGDTCANHRHGWEMCLGELKASLERI
jgi:uncharacterized protein YndB with AHSA1/START domain